MRAQAGAKVAAQGEQTHAKARHHTPRGSPRQPRHRVTAGPAAGAARAPSVATFPLPPPRKAPPSRVNLAVSARFITPSWCRTQPNVDHALRSSLEDVGEAKVEPARRACPVYRPPRKWQCGGGGICRVDLLAALFLAAFLPCGLCVGGRPRLPRLGRHRADWGASTAVDRRGDHAQAASSMNVLVVVFITHTNRDIDSVGLAFFAGV